MNNTMPTDIQSPSESLFDTAAETDTEINTIGIEFEYPIGNMQNGVTASNARRSHDLREETGTGNSWEIESLDGRVPVGQMTRDHIGAEITSAQLELHTKQPELWHAGTVEKATKMGYPHAATGQGGTNFGQHLHLSEMPEEKAQALFEMSQENWFRLFVCTSIGSNTLDPWRHGGIIQQSFERSWEESRSMVRQRSGPGHYEWRLPEPMTTEHFMMVMHFLRILDIEDAEAARDYAHERVQSRDPRLTAVQHFDAIIERRDGGMEWTESALREDNYTDPIVAEETLELLA